MNVIRWTMGCALIAMSAGPALAQSAVQTAFNYDLVNYQCGEPACGCEEPSCGLDDGACADDCADDCCGAADCGKGCCDSGAECCGASCGNGCGNSCCCDRGGWLDGLGDCLNNDCCLGEPCRLKDRVDPCGCCWLDFGGWTQIGYHDDNTRLSNDFNDLKAFNDVPDQLNLHQQYLYAEKVAEAPCCGWDWGFRADLLYGTDAQKTQSFGNDNGTFDAAESFDHGEYGWAIPQLYGEVAFGDWSVIAGHFYTLVGYETVTAPNNFFYSHAYTQFNSEPFTHTGVLATYGGLDNVEVYAGYTLGWDTGFDQAFGGSNFLGGFSTDLSNDLKLTYITTIGNFGARSAGENGYSHSIVAQATLSDRLTYVFQSDLVQHDDVVDAAANVINIGFGEQYGVNQYLFYSFNDCLAAGVRAEWWKSNGVIDVNDTASFYGVTYGLNYKPHANIVIRPEVRHNWTGADQSYAAANGGVNFDQTVFGVDAIFTY